MTQKGVSITSEEMIVSSINMNEPNSSIPIYNGNFLLKQGDIKIVVNGSVYFKWFPDSEAIISGTTSKKEGGIKVLNNLDSFEVYINDLKFGDVYITNSYLSPDSIDIKIKATVISSAILGDRTIKVEKIRFGIPNLRSFHGNPVNKKEGDRISYISSRINFEDEDFKIVIDKHASFNKEKELLSSAGGYMLLFSGELSSKRGGLLLNESEDIFLCLSNFLSLLNGRRTSPLFRQGIVDGEIIWSDYSSYSVDPFKSVISWPPKFSITGLDSIWKEFRKIWQEDGGKDFIVSAVHWYVEANSNSGWAEGSIIMAQTALELIYNWLIVERRKIIIGKDSETISASNKIRLLLSQLKASYGIPKNLEALTIFSTDEEENTDGPDTITQIRNAIVHSRKEKRKKLSKINAKVRYEALQLSVWYVELSILYILNYQENYFNRCTSALYANEGEELVPWMVKN
jgi:hypothetical protein